MDIISYVMARHYTNETASEFGGLKGASAQIQSITNITDSESKVIGKRINFLWENTAGETRTESCDIMYGEKGDTGLGVKSVDVDASNHLIVTYDDDSTEDAGEIKNVTTSISRITDIDLDNLQDGQILKYNATTEKWENQSPGSVDTNLGDLNDVDFDNLTDGQTIIWDATNSKWKNADSSADIQSIGDIDDVDITTPTDGQMLKYNGTSEKWENADMPTIDSAPTENGTNAVQSGGVYTALGGKVDKHSTEGVPDRLMTAAEGTKLAGIAEGADVNVIDAISLNGTDVTPDANKKVALTVITNAVDDLVNYYTKSVTYTKTEVDNIAAAIRNSRFEVVATLPTTDIQTNVIYLVPKDPTQSNNIKDEYINLDGTTAGWEKIGDTEIDLSDYVTTQALNTALADYTTTADLTTLLAAKQDKNLSSAISVDGTPQSTVEGALSAINVLAGANKTALADKADKVSGATNGNFAGLDSNGNLTDSGKKAADFQPVIPESFTGDLNTLSARGFHQYTAAYADLSNAPTVSYTVNKCYIDVWSDGAGNVCQIIKLVGLTYDPAVKYCDIFKRSCYSTGSALSWGTWEKQNGKADKVTSATAGNLAGLDSSGNIADSNISSNDIRKTAMLSNSTSSEVIFKISGFGLNTGSLFVIRARGGESILFALGNASQDVEVSYGYSAFRVLGSSGYKINAMTYDYANNELYVNLGNYSILSIIQISGVTKYDLTITSVNSIPTTDIYKIPIQNLVDVQDRIKETVGWTGRNRYNKATGKANTVVSQNGESTSSTYNNFNASDYIEVEANTSYYLQNGCGNTTQNTACVYDSSKTFLRYAQLSGSGVQSGIISTGANAKYIRLNVLASYVDTCMLSKGSDTNVTYESYHESVEVEMANNIGKITAEQWTEIETILA